MLCIKPNKYSIFKIRHFLARRVANHLKFIYSEKAAKFCETSTLLLSYVVTDKSKVEISQNVVAFSEYMNMVAKSDWQGTMTIFHWNFLIKPELELERERNFGTS